MQYSTNYNLNLVEGTDIVNPLVNDKPNYQRIDSAMKSNKDSSIDSASHTKAGTVHAIVRSNRDAATFKFVASAPYVAGDTFTVDGNSVTGINTAGEGLGTNDFVIGASVLCVLNSGTLTLNVNKNVSIPATYDADDIVFDNTGTDLVATNAEDAIKEINSKATLSVDNVTSIYNNTAMSNTTFNQTFTLANDSAVLVNCGYSNNPNSNYVNLAIKANDETISQDILYEQKYAFITRCTPKLKKGTTVRVYGTLEATAYATDAQASLIAIYTTD